MLELIKENLCKIMAEDDLQELTKEDLEKIIDEQLKFIEPLVKANQALLSNNEELEKFKTLIVSFIDRED